jgi:hypothetical protein
MLYRREPRLRMNPAGLCEEFFELPVPKLGWIGLCQATVGNTRPRLAALVDLSVIPGLLLLRCEHAVTAQHFLQLIMRQSRDRPIVRAGHGVGGYQCVDHGFLDSLNRGLEQRI